MNPAITESSDFLSNDLDNQEDDNSETYSSAANISSESQTQNHRYKILYALKNNLDFDCIAIFTWIFRLVVLSMSTYNCTNAEIILDY